jgi:hypothetical protein
MAGEKGDQRPLEQGAIPQRPAYFSARRYSSEQAAGSSYYLVQETMRNNPEITELSAYRVRVAPSMDYHVVVLGDTTPPEPLRDKLSTALQTGQPVQIPK